jgi:DtxR family Mn-dependent transcriptional regulator
MVTNASEQQTASMEDYLEAVIILQEQGGKTTVTALSDFLNVKKPSVDWALKRLSDAGLVIHEKYGDVKLTAEGARIAQDVYHRHKTLRRFLIEILNVDPAVADGDACRTEHVLSRTSLERLAKFLDFVLNCPRGEPEWLKGLNYYFEHDKRDEELLAKCQREE